MKMKRFLLFVLLTVAITYGSLPIWQRAVYTPEFVRVIGSDEELILAGLKEKKSFLQTFEWYKEKWCGGVSFYRPITSQLFWLEKKVFGDKNLQYWLMVGIVFHTVTMILGFLVIEKIFGSTILAFLTIALFAGLPIYLPFPRSSISGLSWGVVGPIGGQHFVAVGMWKNAPEFWVAIPIFIGILGFLVNKPLVALSCAILAILTKEIGFGVIPAFALISWYKQKTYPTWFWATGTIVTVGLFVYRYIVLEGFGYRLGSNNSWLHRVVVYYGGTIGDQLASRMFPVAIFSVSIGIAIVCFIQANHQKQRQYDLLGLLAIVGGLSIATLITTTDWWIGGKTSYLVGSMMILSVNNAWLVVSIALIIAGGVSAVRLYRRECVFIAAWMLIFSAGLFTAAQVQGHAFYLSNLIRTAFYWFGMFAIWNLFKPDSHFAFLAREGDFLLPKENRFPLGFTPCKAGRK